MLGLGGIVVLIFLQKAFLKNNTPILPKEPIIPENYTCEKYAKQLLLSIARLVDDKKVIKSNPTEKQVVEALEQIGYIQFRDKNNPETRPLIRQLSFYPDFYNYMDVFTKAINGKTDTKYPQVLFTLEKLTAIKKIKMMSLSLLIGMK